MKKKGKINKTIDKEGEWEGFDDCPICQAMKNGKANTVEGLKKAFDEANKIKNKELKDNIIVENDKDKFIERKRKEIKQGLRNFLKEINHLMTADEILDEVLNDDNGEDFEDFVIFLAQDSMIEDPDLAQELAMDLFNYFPRKTLKGKSLAELMSFDELKKMEDAFQNYKKGLPTGGYSYTLPSDFENPKMTMKVANKDDLYYDAMEQINMGRVKEAEEFLKKALELDSNYVQTYVGLSCLYGNFGGSEKAKEYIKIAFEKTQKKFPKWPKKMIWGILENRAYLRAMQYQADLYADSGEKEKAIDLYRLILKLNPNDNQGARYVLAGLYAGVDGKKINQMFDNGNKNQDWDKLEKLVSIQNNKHNFWIEPKDE
ncbi:MAG: hypothetical protein NTU76_03670 [Candidatus Taylorbacteria bacterium]|nr:hypothetical protein [Candidatus Taylorbacteria bacterium]